MNKMTNRIVAGKINKRAALWLFVILLLVVGVIFYIARDSSLGASEARQEVGQKEIEEVLEKVGRLFVLPQGEAPVMATVVNAEDLKAEQPFYSNVIEGDKVLVYLQNQQAIIYSPSRNMIVNVGPVVINNQNQQ